jgi:hypothetical protein
LDQQGQVATLQVILQVVGSVGVIGSLVYFAIQIRNNARARRAATYLQISHTQRSALYNIASNADLAELVIREGSDFGALKGLDWARFRFHTMFVLTFNQNNFFQHKIGMATGNDCDSFKYDLVYYLDVVGALAGWPTCQKRLDKTFQAHVDKITGRLTEKSLQQSSMPRSNRR